MTNKDLKVQVRAKYMTLDPAANRYVKYIRNIRTIQVSQLSGLRVLLRSVSAILDACMCCAVQLLNTHLLLHTP